MTVDRPIRLAILSDPASTRRGVDASAIEALLGAWLKSPVALGHREDGSPLLTGADGVHISLSHAIGATAVAMADRSVGVDIAATSHDAGDRVTARSLFTSSERAWLGALPAERWPAGFATLWTLKEALLKRDRRGLDTHDLPDVGTMIGRLGAPPPLAAITWRPWAVLAPSAHPTQNSLGLTLALPMTHLTTIGAEPVAVAIFAAPVAPLALALAWTAEMS